MLQLPSFPSRFLTFRAVDHEEWMGSPCLFFSSQLSVSLRLLHYSLHPAALFLFLGTPAHPAVMSVLISPTWPWQRQSCALALDSSLCLLVFKGSYLTVSAGFSVSNSQPVFQKKKKRSQLVLGLAWEIVNLYLMMLV